MGYGTNISYFSINMKEKERTERVMKQNKVFFKFTFKPDQNVTFLFEAVPTNNREHDTEGRPGEDIILLCSEDGDPLEATRWIRNGVSILPGPKYALQGNRLTIRQATRSDFGRYECFPENTLGFARNVVNLGFRGSFLQKYSFLHCSSLF